MAQADVAEAAHSNGSGSANGEIHAAASAAAATAENGDAAHGTGKKSKADKAKEKKKKQKASKQLRRQQQLVKASNGPAALSADEDDEKIEIEYVSAPIELESLNLGESRADEEDDGEGRGGLGSTGGLGSSSFSAGGLGFTRASTEGPSAADAAAELRKVFEHFASAEVVTGAVVQTDSDDDEDARQDRLRDDKKATTSDAGSDDDEDAAKKKMSKKQRKLLTRLKISDLKQVCERPDVVEVWDVTAPDPQLLVFLKATRNTVPIPRHWSQKRKYLQGKRGLEKPAFKLPDYIEATGIGEMRQTYLEKEDGKKLKQKQRDKMQPKMGKMSIDYQVLHDAFFKYSSKPSLTGMGEIYYEGREFETKRTSVKPGVLSEELKKALGMGEVTPPPWLINMQRYGPPPSYPNLKVPGLSAPIPPGASFGYHTGGWGKPPVDEDGNPLYGDVFGQVDDGADSDNDVVRGNHWGELDPDAEESEEEEEEEEEAGDDDDEIADGTASGIVSGLTSGLASGIASSLPSGIDTPEVFNLRKNAESEARALYTVLEQKNTSVGSDTLMGSDHVYVMPGADGKGGAALRKRPDGKAVGPGGADVEITLNPEELEGLDEAGVAALYEQRLAEARGVATSTREDFSDMVAAKAAQQKRKLAAKTAGESGGGGGKAAKKSKTDNFKF